MSAAGSCKSGAQRTKSGDVASQAFSEKMQTEFPQGLKPDHVNATYSAAEQAAEKIEKADSPQAEASEE
jgi:hypothetical protein